jgi:hypothetical protein
MLLFRELVEQQKNLSTPTIAELLDELSTIQSENPVDLTIPPRTDRANPFQYGNKMKVFCNTNIITWLLHEI